MEIYEKKLTVKSDYAAMNGYLRPSSMFAIMQDAAAADAALRGAGDDVTAHRGILWMVVHMRTQVFSLPRFGSDVTVCTWLGEENHGLYTRYYEMRYAGGDICVKASGTWVLVDASTRSLLRDPDVKMPLITTGSEGERPRKLRLPELSHSAAFTARYSQADINGHMNNAKYLDAAEDMMPVDYLMRHRLNSACVDYLREVVPGETLSIRYGCDGGEWWFSGETEEPCFRIKLVYD